MCRAQRCVWAILDTWSCAATIIAASSDVSAMSTTDGRPLVSVIIPAYRAAAYIHETLESALCQTYPNFEVVLINDGSPDTEEFERAIAPYRHRIVYISQENRGPSAARNAGIHRARGEYLAFLDSDDVWFPTCLTARVELALSRQPACDLVYADVLISSESQQRGHRAS